MVAHRGSDASWQTFPLCICNSQALLFLVTLSLATSSVPYVQAFREDRTLIAASDYIADALGQRFVESVPLNMERAWSESHPKCPLICLLSPGADPTKLIEVSPGRSSAALLTVYICHASEHQQD